MPAFTHLEKFSLTKTVTSHPEPEACDFLSLESGLSKGRVKDAMNKGAVWLSRKGLGRIRLRKATFRLQKGDKLELHYDPKVLAVHPPQAECLDDYGQYSLWFKPANLLTQGTDFGDHVSLMRQIEMFFKPKREVYPVHRLDREAQGLILVAHSQKAASRLSRMFQNHEIIKRYRVEVMGMPEDDAGLIDQPLDGKPSLTRYRVVSRLPDTRTAVLIAEIETGRLHQIRRHLAYAGHPVMGDPRYGEGNKDGKPMRLVACELEWTCPVTGKIRKFHLPPPSN